MGGGDLINATTEFAAASSLLCCQLFTPFYNFATPKPTPKPSSLAPITSNTVPPPAPKPSTTVPTPAPKPSTPRPMPAPKPASYSYTDANKNNQTFYSYCTNGTSSTKERRYFCLLPKYKTNIISNMNVMNESLPSKQAEMNQDNLHKQKTKD